VSHASKTEFNAVHLVPFRAGIKAGAEGVMVGHILAKVYDPARPASSSSKVIGDLLRERLGFTGVVITDALEMAAARQSEGAVDKTTAATVAETAVAALEAGADLLISTGTLQGQKSILAAIVEAVETGRLSVSRLDEAVLRVLELKARHDLLAP
jgi:beta-N-acetylhexosaminidase